MAACAEKRIHRFHRFLPAVELVELPIDVVVGKRIIA